MFFLQKKRRIWDPIPFFSTSPATSTSALALRVLLHRQPHHNHHYHHRIRIIIVLEPGTLVTYSADSLLLLLLILILVVGSFCAVLLTLHFFSFLAVWLTKACCPRSFLTPGILLFLAKAMSISGQNRKRERANESKMAGGGDTGVGDSGVGGHWGTVNLCSKCKKLKICNGKDGQGNDSW